MEFNNTSSSSSDCYAIYHNIRCCLRIAVKPSLVWLNLYIESNCIEWLVVHICFEYKWVWQGIKRAQILLFTSFKTLVFYEWKKSSLLFSSLGVVFMLHRMLFYLQRNTLQAINEKALSHLVGSYVHCTMYTFDIFHIQFVHSNSSIECLNIVHNISRDFFHFWVKLTNFRL